MLIICFKLVIKRENGFNSKSFNKLNKMLPFHVFNLEVEYNFHVIIFTLM